MDPVFEIKKNTSDIQALTLQMTRLATIVEQTEKNRDKDGASIHEVAQSIASMNEKIGSALSMSKDILAIREKLAERSQELSGLRHDVKNIDQALQAIPLLKEKVSQIDKQQGIDRTDIDALQKWRDQIDGGGRALKGMAIALWTMFGGVIIGGAFWLIEHFTGAKISGE